MSRILNRLIRGRQKSDAMASSSETDDVPRQDNTLALTHLKKIFADFRHPGPTVTIQSQEEKLYSMIPLFNRVHFHTFVVLSTQYFCVVCLTSFLRRYNSNFKFQLLRTKCFKYLYYSCTYGGLMYSSLFMS